MEEEQKLDQKTERIIEAIHEIKRLCSAPVGIDTALTRLYDDAHKAGRQSLLRDAQTLVGGRSVLDTDDDLEAAKGRQLLKAMEMLTEWMALDPEHNTYRPKRISDLPGNPRMFSVRLQYREAIGGAWVTSAYGSTHQEALVNAAQQATVFLDEAKNGS